MLSRPFSLLIATILAYSHGASLTFAEEPITIAVAGPVSGASFSVGMQYKAGVEGALHAKTDGTINGRPWILSSHDDKCERALAKQVALHVATQVSPDVLFGHSCSSASIAAAPTYAEHGILQISPASSSPRLTELGIDTVFRMIGRDDVQATLVAERIAKHYPEKNIGIMHYPGGYSFELARMTRDQLQERGIEPVLVLEGQPDVDSYVPQITAFEDAGVDILYLIGGALDSGVFVRQARLMGTHFDILSSDTLVSRIFVETAGDTADGVIFTAPTGATDITLTDQMKETLSRLNITQAEAGYSLMAYAATEVWLMGVARASSFDAKQVAKAIRAEPIETLFGPVQFDAKGDISTSFPLFTWRQWKNGQLVRAD